VASVARNPVYSPEMAKSRWFAMMRSAMMSSGGTSSSNATGWEQGRHESDDCEPLNDTPLYAYSNTYTNLTL